MIIQNTGTNQATPLAKQVGSDAPKLVAASKPIAPEPSPQQLQQAVQAINSVMQLSSRNLEFSVDPDTDKAIVQMTDAETGELIRQIPSKEALAIARAIDQFQHRQGLLFSQKA